jgi:hypothetical protein
LINDQYVLTAAHCKTRIPNSWRLTAVRLGEWDLRTNPDCEQYSDGDEECNEPHVDIPVAEIIVHPEYYYERVAQYHDIALLRLQRKVEFNKWIQPICLPIDSRIRSMDFASHSLEVSGFGLTEDGVSSPVKKKVVLEGRTLAECKELYNKLGVRIIEKHVSCKILKF